MTTAGLINIGNTCAINTILQSICNTIENEKEILISREKFTLSLLKIIRMMKENKNKGIKPYEFVNDLINNSNELFKKGHQMDASELWTFICNIVFKETSKEIEEKEGKEYKSEIHKKAYIDIKKHNNEKECEWNKKYQGSTITIIKCLKCGEKYYNIETFYNLSINVEEDTIIRNLINFFKLTENEDEWKCEKCKEKSKYMKSTKIWKAPEILVITLNRFDNKMNKINKEIEINQIINMKQGVVLNEIEKQYVYKLKNSIHHQGVYQGGHYISRIYEGDKETEYDDSTISKKEKENKSKDVYIIYYELEKN